MSHPLGIISRLYRYPVKSLAGEPLDHATLDERGIEGDRGRALFVASEDNARTGKPYRGKENNLLHTLQTQDAARDLARARGVAVEVHVDGPYFDQAPVSIIFTTWLTKLEDLVYEPIDPLRFRANIYVDAAPGFSEREEDLIGKTFVVGDVSLECTETIKRCVTITYDIPTGRPDPNIGRVVANALDNVMGIYCNVTRNGTLSTGDTLVQSNPHPRSL